MLRYFIIKLTLMIRNNTDCVNNILMWSTMMICFWSTWRKRSNNLQVNDKSLCLEWIICECQLKLKQMSYIITASRELNVETKFIRSNCNLRLSANEEIKCGLVGNGSLMPVQLSVYALWTALWESLAPQGCVGWVIF